MWKYIPSWLQPEYKSSGNFHQWGNNFWFNNYFLIEERYIIFNRWETDTIMCSAHINISLKFYFEKNSHIPCNGNTVYRIWNVGIFSHGILQGPVLHNLEIFSDWKRLLNITDKTVQHNLWSNRTALMWFWNQWRTQFEHCHPWCIETEFYEIILCLVVFLSS
jgi:hypothetical protein